MVIGQQTPASAWVSRYSRPAWATWAPGRRAVQAMEWVDGFDLRHLLTPRTLDDAKAGMSPQRWQYMNDVIVTKTASQLRLKPGVAAK